MSLFLSRAKSNVSTTLSFVTSSLESLIRVQDVVKTEVMILSCSCVASVIFSFNHLTPSFPIASSALPTLSFFAKLGFQPARVICLRVQQSLRFISLVVSGGGGSHPDCHCCYHRR